MCAIMVVSIYVYVGMCAHLCMYMYDVCTYMYAY